MRSWKMKDLSEKQKLRYSLLRRGKDRKALLNNLTDGRPTYGDVVMMRKLLKSLAELVGSQKRTVLKGLGVFEWRPIKKKVLPTGKIVEKTWRLVFKLTHSARKFPR